MNIEFAVLILFLHWIGDFLLQNTGMAMGKSKENKWLTLHIIAYSLPFIVTGLILLLVGFPKYYGIWLLLNLILHWITDYFTSRWTSKLYAEKKFYGFPAFFSIIGLDQFIHGATLLLTSKYILF